VIHGEDVPDYVVYENPALQQKMKPRHLQMIAVGGSIGTGLFVSSPSGRIALELVADTPNRLVPEVR
jgi:amino acid permease